MHQVDKFFKVQLNQTGEEPNKININSEGLTILSTEQIDRGKRGEEEIKKRLMLPNGWAGFTLKADKRNDGCGYDFLCILDAKEVKLEVKTFAQNGRIIISSRELQAAAEDPNNYYLIGVLDDEDIEKPWSEVGIIYNPLEILITRGNFDFQAKLTVVASEIFEKLKGN